MRNTLSFLFLMTLAACGGKESVDGDATSPVADTGTTIKMLNTAPDGSRTDLAKTLDGGPDYWQVAGIATDASLEVRGSASTTGDVLMRVKNGSRLQNQGCKKLDSGIWCQVARPDAPDDNGWVPGRYLREASDTPVNDIVNSQVIGDVVCKNANATEKPTKCRYRAVRGGNGNASIWVTTSTGDERFIEFRSGEPSTTGVSADLSFQLSDDLYLIEFGDDESYEIPASILFDN
ncbi:MAG TPA: hypothetical protein PKK10_10735 [Woeseiaceae bacterium]|nr:hypothetical protein [Woeseiaceae bacterium]